MVNSGTAGTKETESAALVPFDKSVDVWLEGKVSVGDCESAASVSDDELGV